MMTFSTHKRALKYLELRRRYVIKKIEQRGDVVISDDSFAGYSFSVPGRFEAFVMIWTRDMIEAIKNYKGFDYEEYEELLKKVNI